MGVINIILMLQMMVPNADSTQGSRCSMILRKDGRAAIRSRTNGKNLKELWAVAWDHTQTMLALAILNSGSQVLWPTHHKLCEDKK